jgi:hypothetical protein
VTQARLEAAERQCTKEALVPALSEDVQRRVDATVERAIDSSRLGPFLRDSSPVLTEV